MTSLGYFERESICQGEPKGGEKGIRGGLSVWNRGTVDHASFKKANQILMSVSLSWTTVQGRRAKTVPVPPSVE